MSRNFSLDCGWKGLVEKERNQNRRETVKSDDRILDGELGQGLPIKLPNPHRQWFWLVRAMNPRLRQKPFAPVRNLSFLLHR